MSVKKQDILLVDAFTSQYKSCLLLLAFGIPGLPYDLVYLIVKNYVYVKPLRISCKCESRFSGFISVFLVRESFHEMIGMQDASTRGEHILSWSHASIIAWFEKHNFRVPEHFLQF